MKNIMNLDNFPCLKNKEEDYDGAMGYDEWAESEESTFISDLAKYAKDNKSSKNKSGIPAWVIILIVILVIVVVDVVVVVIVVMVIVVKKKKGGYSDNKEEMGGDNKEEVSDPDSTKM